MAFFDLCSEAPLKPLYIQEGLESDLLQKRSKNVKGETPNVN